MSTTTQSGENITSTLPSSTLRELLKMHEGDYRLCKERLPEIIQQVKDWRSESYPDLLSIQSREEVRETWKLKIEGYTLLMDLCDKIDANPFPGKQLRVTKVAVMLSPEVGKRRWWRIFELYDIRSTLLITFPVQSESLDVRGLEEQLLQLAGERDSLLVQEAAEVLHWVPTSRTYKRAKSALEERGWEWKCVKRAGRVSKVICVPKR
jgi:mRNA-degrading endonuclease RelE of RelBE toxin-antitoxin system